MRVYVFSCGSNPAIDPPLRKASAYRAEQEVLTGRAERLATGSIRMLPAREFSYDRLKKAAGLEDWRVVTEIFCGQPIGMTTLQLRTR